MQRETDRRNLAEIHASHVSRAVALCRERMAEGADVSTASAQACAYLRRKTGWLAPLALGALDSAMRDQYKAG